jgi:hypothetical protein
MRISRKKVEAMAKRSHAKCHGTGILGYRRGDVAVLCTCVVRNLRRKNVNQNSPEEMKKAIGPDPPPETVATAPGKYPPGWPFDKNRNPGPLLKSEG